METSLLSQLYHKNQWDGAVRAQIFWKKRECAGGGFYL